MLARSSRRSRCAIPLVLAGVAACGGASVEVPSPYIAHAVPESARRYVQAERPADCEGVTQPAIVDFADVPPVAVWVCLPACRTGEEYVTHLRVMGHNADGRPVVIVDPVCELGCPADAPRAAWVAFGDRGQCGSAPDASGAAAVEDGERRRLARAREALEERRIAEVERCLVPVRSSEPWSVSTLRAFRACQADASRVTWEHEELEPASRGACAEDQRVCGRLAAVFRELRALDAKASDAVRALGYHRGTTRAERIARCEESCASQRDTCGQDCGALPPGACQACREQAASCASACAAREES